MTKIPMSFTLCIQSGKAQILLQALSLDTIQTPKTQNLYQRGSSDMFLHPESHPTEVPTPSQPPSSFSRGNFWMREETIILIKTWKVFSPILHSYKAQWHPSSTIHHPHPSILEPAIIKMKVVRLAPGLFSWQSSRAWCWSGGCTAGRTQSCSAL